MFDHVSTTIDWVHENKGRCRTDGIHWKHEIDCRPGGYRVVNRLCWSYDCDEVGELSIRFFDELGDDHQRDRLVPVLLSHIRKQDSPKQRVVLM